MVDLHPLKMTVPFWPRLFPSPWLRRGAEKSGLSGRTMKELGLPGQAPVSRVMWNPAAVTQECCRDWRECIMRQMEAGRGLWGSEDVFWGLASEKYGGYILTGKRTFGEGAPGFLTESP